MDNHLVMLIGVPGSGKSTFVNGYIVQRSLQPHEYTVLSTDNFIEDLATKNGTSYNQEFNPENMKLAEKHMNEQLASAIKNETKYIIWDQTNLTKKSRKSKLARIPNRYIKTAVFIKTPDSKTLDKRLEERSGRSGKTIPKHVVALMVQTLELPSYDEGFDGIINYTGG